MKEDTTMSSTTQNQSKTGSLSHQRILYLTTSALFAALICITTAYILHIPVGANSGYVHVGDAIIYLAASVLPTPYAMIAAGIGGAMADLLTAPVWAVATFIIKMINVLPFTWKKDKIINKRNVIALVISGLITFIGYYIAEGIMFGSWAALLASLLSGWIQPLGSAIVFLILGTALDHLNFKQKFFKMK